MTREEAINIMKVIVQMLEEKYDTDRVEDAVDMAIKALEQEPKTWQFAKWVATEIFDEMWEYNKDAFAEIACRKLAKLGIVRENGDKWELVEPQESEDEEQEPKTGHWIKIQKTQKGCHDTTVITYEYHCSECDSINVSPYKNFCPICGARMKGRTEE